ncbi:electron transport complex subunit RsxC [Clostridium subterminale]|uniref:Ion-translocating oxidoreductase complex subunit C n=1 Tax=Clostridium subterminale TaxID=1550 RepID=A0ABP3W7P9_CLOSU
MGLLTFKRGIHPPHGKHFSEKKEIETYLPKGDLVFPMSQHIGAPCEPIVKKGDKVLVGQKIGASTSFVSSNIYSSVSGIVKNVTPMLTSSGSKVISVIIENDNTYEEMAYTPHENYKNLSKNELLEIIQEAGIVGLGGACFPTHVKLNPPKECNIDTIIINAAECEPYLTCDHQLMLQYSKEIAEGLEIVSQMFPDVKIFLGIENNKSDAITIMKAVVESIKNVEIAELKTKYPQGAEKQLIYSVTKREVPTGKLPADAGCIVQNVATIFAIREAVILGKPLTERIVTVTGGAIKTPKNLRVKFGTSLKELIDHCDGFNEQPIKVLSGGPMMGTALFTLDIPAIKGTSGILCLTKVEAVPTVESNCIRCGKCVNACPMFLLPNKLNAQVVRGDYENFEKFGGLNCIECGACSYSCPAKRNLTQTCKEGKKRVIANRKKK